MPHSYTPPLFLQGQSVDEIHRRMMDDLPPGIDKSEGQIPWDFTRPAATEKSEFVEFQLNEAIQLAFPQWAYGEWLDRHAEMARVTRRAANRAYGVITVRGIPGTVIPSGFQFATPAGLMSSVIYTAIGGVTLSGTPDANGQVSASVTVRAADGGIEGNAPPDTVIFMVKPISGITAVTNEYAMTGGTEPEDDEALRERVLSSLRLGSSFVGRNADYIRWAQEVDGVGAAICIPEANGPGTVELVIVDGNGIPANQQILDDVYAYIMGSGPTDINRLAPIGASLTVSAPTGVTVDISAAVLLQGDTGIEAVKSLFLGNLLSYWQEVAQGTQDNEDRTNHIRYVMVGAALANTPGVIDYSGLLVNSGTANIVITQETYPVTGTVTFTVMGD